MDGNRLKAEHQIDGDLFEAVDDLDIDTVYDGKDIEVEMKGVDF